ncbi:hypothetical protein C943_03287 [Mariniradius saccharolyticus AK6]|uniref:Peptidase S49 domain-containing protein n=1 Tax=Mariniradius saccharolyticus AK6 TaxID=1239962 RepID=M7XAZ0_9BACT|nr:S49 family peptidase [Mariniradius saccharolyticus]EMS34600.1 hypothetical protein C943_03287 [Mariniradius saccharolyticus AK6]
MTKLAANWPYLLISQIVKGKFFLRPEIALAMGPQVGRLLSESGGSTGAVEEREIQILCIDPQGKEIAMMREDGQDPNETISSLYDEAPEGSVALIPIKGTMLKYGTMCDYGATELAEFISGAANHKNIGSIVLDIDSGGGAVDAVAPLIQAIGRSRTKMRKPVVASVDMACSAAYWVASATDQIIADNNISSEVGSIGVMMSFYDVRGYYEKEGVKFHTIYSNESPDKNLAFQKALDGDYDMIREEELDPLARSFQAAIRENRKGKLLDKTPGILSGKTFFADQAKAVGLIDQIGDNTRAIEFALQLSHARKSIFNL